VLHYPLDLFTREVGQLAAAQREATDELRGREREREEGREGGSGG